MESDQGKQNMILVKAQCSPLGVKSESVSHHTHISATLLLGMPDNHTPRHCKLRSPHHSSFSIIIQFKYTETVCFKLHQCTSIRISLFFTLGHIPIQHHFQSTVRELWNIH